jgi:hypothetical protein
MPRFTGSDVAANLKPLRQQLQELRIQLIELGTKRAQKFFRSSGCHILFPYCET